ncbi:hypothetical protein IPC1415_04120 [Pseudomonas aeruginosa]|nr:hypothetical protein IPC1415_04120 [Pseudomonas aeruginosa]
MHLEYLFCQIQTNATKVHADSPSGTCGCTISLALDAVGGRSPFHCPTPAPTCFRRTGSPSCGRQATRVRFPVPAARR